MTRPRPMPLFSVIFTDPAVAIVSARVAAETREDALDLIVDRLALRRVPARTIVAVMGGCTEETPTIVSTVARASEASR